MCGAIFPKQTVVFVRIAGSLSVCEAHAVGTRVRYSEGLTLRHCTRRLAVSSIGYSTVLCGFAGALPAAEPLSLTPRRLKA